MPYPLHAPAEISGLRDSVLGSLWSLCELTPDRPLLTFVDDEGNDQETLTAHGLAAAAAGVAAILRERRLAPGDRAVLVYPPSSDFIKGFLGCLMAGVVPVPVYPPNPLTLRRDLGGFNRIVANSGAKVALTNSEYDRGRKLAAVSGFFQPNMPRWPSVTWCKTDGAGPAPVDPARWHAPGSADDLAFLQYTSGSTSDPKGVMVTHRNLHDELASNAEVLGLGPDARAVFWVPSYHDLGLISGLLSAVTGNGHLYVMSPLTFLRRPGVWFDVMSRVRATHTASPNFGLEQAVRKTTPEMRRNWDLSSMRVVLSAAEPIRPATVEKFYEAFAGTGLRRDTFCPSYGLAESTVSVSVWGRKSVRVDRVALDAGRVVPVGGHSADAVSFLGCGPVVKADAKFWIVDPDSGRPREADEVGEIWVSSSTVCQGYYGMPEQSAETFGAVLTGVPDDSTYLRTGDLGFLHDGELYVTGRQKDLIIINGRNLYPQDIEDTVRECHPSVRPGGVVAFSVDGSVDDGEKLAIFVETREKPTGEQEARDIAAEVRKTVFVDHRISVGSVVVGPAGLVRKTTSGKVRRRACRQAFLDGEVTGRRGIHVFGDSTFADSASTVTPEES